jgi:hypothetical protein
MCTLCFKLAGLVLSPGKASVFRYGSLVLKTVDVSNLSENTCSVDLSNAFNGAFL